MLLSAERILINGTPEANVGIEIDGRGVITKMGPLEHMGPVDLSLQGRILLPGFVNTHSHAFQRLLRGRTQHRLQGENNFWSWRNVMFEVASKLDPEGMYIASRQAFLEMALCGITSVGEFHYIHHQPSGLPYANPSIMAESIAQAAHEVGIRVCLLRTIYLQGNFGIPPNAHQKRFADTDLDASWRCIEAMIDALSHLRSPLLSWGLAAHSLRAVSIEDLIGIKTNASHLPIHIHVSEQPKEVNDCIDFYGTSPVNLLARSGILDSGTTLIHATHLYPGEIEHIAQQGAQVCICPSTEADLGDGHAPAAELHEQGVPISLGSDGQTLTSIQAEASRLEMHERLRHQKRNILVSPNTPATAHTLLEVATRHGANALDLSTGQIAVGKMADFVAYNLADPSLITANEEHLLEHIIYSSDSRAVQEVIVGGKVIISEGMHALAQKISEDFKQLCDRMFS
jgi:formimidoylglutamate deiminase